MIKSIVDSKILNNQQIDKLDIVNRKLIAIGIDLAGSFLGLMDCKPELENNPHAIKAKSFAHEWNKMFVDEYVLTREVK